MMTAGGLESALRRIGAERYHNNHPFHKRLHAGEMTKAQVQAWALNRFYYQAMIPVKDSAIMARMIDPDLRREWRQRVIDHDGEEPGDGGNSRSKPMSTLFGKNPCSRRLPPR